jgi:hypothetical protein
MMLIFCFVAGIVALISVITFIVGFFMQFSEKKKKLGLQMILYSVIAFVIGFGTCVATLNLN